MKGSNKPGDLGAEAAKGKLIPMVSGGETKLQQSSAHPTKKTRKPLTPEEKAQQKQRLMSISEEEKRKAMIFLFNWITWWLNEHGFNRQKGPFSDIEMKGEADLVIGNDCYLKIYEGDWRWHKNWKLSTQLIQVAKSIMLHIIRDYKKRHCNGELLTCDMTPSQLKKLDEAERQLTLEFDMREEGFKIAEQIVSDNPLFMLYLEALKEYNCYKLIAKKMDMEVKEVLKLERKMLNFIRKKLHR